MLTFAKSLESSPAEGALRADILQVPAETWALCKRTEADAVSGLRYIEQHYGRLDGVGFDRVFEAHERLQALTPTETGEQEEASTTPPADADVGALVAALRAVAVRLIDQHDEPWPGSLHGAVGNYPGRMNYWRDKAIDCANDIKDALRLIDVGVGGAEG